MELASRSRRDEMNFPKTYIVPNGVPGVMGQGTDKDNTVGFILSRTSSAPEDPIQILRVARSLQQEGHHVEFFLIGDGVWLAKSGHPETSPILTELISDGAKITLSGDHLKASGLSEDVLLEGVNTVEKPFEVMVEQVMERWGQVFSF